MRLARRLLLGLEARDLDGARRAWLAGLEPGGVVLGTSGAGSLEALRELVRELKERDPALLVAMRQEGDPVDPLGPLVSPFPSACALGRTGDPDLVRRAGELTGSLLSWLGVDLDLAPVADFALSPEDNDMGLSSFGSDAEAVPPLVGAFLAGLESRGVVGCLKHFPGLGSAPADPRRTLPVVALARADLAAAELGAFERLLGAAGAVLVSHGYYPHLTTRGVLPASLSEEVVTDLLKRELEFPGAALSDDLALAALAAEPPEVGAVRSLGAGTDLLLVGADPDTVGRILEALEEAAARKTLVPMRLHEAERRAAGLRSRLERLRLNSRAPAAGRAGSASFRKNVEELAQEVAARSVGPLGRLPPRERAQGPVWVLRPREQAPAAASPFLLALAEARLEATEVAYDPARADEEVAALLDGERRAGAFLLATRDVHRQPAVERAARTLALAAPVYHLALGWPSEPAGVELRASVASLGAGPAAVLAACRVLFGLVRPQAGPGRPR